MKGKKQGKQRSYQKRKFNIFSTICRAYNVYVLNIGLLSKAEHNMRCQVQFLIMCGELCTH